MSEQGIDVSEAQHHGHHTINLFVDGVGVTTHAHRLNGLQIRELGARDRVHGFKTEIVSGHVRVIADHEEVELHNEEHFRTVIEIYLDGELVISRLKTLTGDRSANSVLPTASTGLKPRKSMSTGKRSGPSGTPNRSKSTSMSGFGRSRTTGARCNLLRNC